VYEAVLESNDLGSILQLPEICSQYFSQRISQKWAAGARSRLYQCRID
jgi:hypothetical protein